ncbi:hypothetical protein IPL68_01160 [Candidatus Saccharibacteria bacterium]|nr:MAG: hypothetical protein IPL68_01160 [Candidatus Saccharibacteria bacterium]
MAQQLMLDIVLNLEDGALLDINALKLNANDFAKKVEKKTMTIKRFTICLSANVSRAYQSRLMIQNIQQINQTGKRCRK